MVNNYIGGATHLDMVPYGKPCPSLSSLPLISPSVTSFPPPLPFPALWKLVVVVRVVVKNTQLKSFSLYRRLVWWWCGRRQVSPDRRCSSCRRLRSAVWWLRVVAVLTREALTNDHPSLPSPRTWSTWFEQQHIKLMHSGISLSTVTFITKRCYICIVQGSTL